MHSGHSRFEAAAVAVACLLAATSIAAPAAGVRAAIEMANARFGELLSNGDAAGIVAMYAAEAQVFPPNSDIVSGATAIQKLWQGVIDSGVKGAKLTTLDVTAGGDLASESGRYEMAGADGKTLDRGKYVVVWKRVGGQWKLFRDIWNTSMPAAR